MFWMNIYNLSSLTAYYKVHPDCKKALQKWYHDLLGRKWYKPNDVTKDYNTARAIKNNRVIFNINDNDYRLIVEINYQKGWVFIKFIGTHAEYDKIDPTMVNFFRSEY